MARFRYDPYMSSGSYVIEERVNQAVNQAVKLNTEQVTEQVTEQKDNLRFLHGNAGRT